jgi:hypothetical protein
MSKFAYNPEWKEPSYDKKVREKRKSYQHIKQNKPTGMGIWKKIAEQ